MNINREQCKTCPVQAWCKSTLENGQLQLNSTQEAINATAASILAAEIQETENNGFMLYAQIAYLDRDDLDGQQKADAFDWYDNVKKEVYDATGTTLSTMKGTDDMLQAYLDKTTKRMVLASLIAEQLGNPAACEIGSTQQLNQSPTQSLFSRIFKRTPKIITAEPGITIGATTCHSNSISQDLLEEFSSVRAEQLDEYNALLAKNAIISY